jgi:hypothetical protein
MKEVWPRAGPFSLLTARGVEFFLKKNIDSVSFADLVSSHQGLLEIGSYVFFA